MKKWLIMVFAVCSLSACVAPPTPPVVELNPQPAIHARSLGQGKAIALQVVDARTPGFSSANIDPQQNVAQIFTQQLNRALTAYNFSAVTIPQQQNQPQLTLRILNIDYGVARGYFGSNTETTVSAQVQAKSPRGSYTQTYTASAYSDNYLTQGKQTPSQQVNAAVNQLLTNLFNDQLLWQFLAS